MPMNDRPAGFGATNVLIGVDDTDNLDSKGTGFFVQRLMEALEEEGLGTPVGATRHQLLVDPRIPYTSHNSSACLAWRTASDDQLPGIVALAGEFLATQSASGSDPGLAVATVASWARGGLPERLAAFGWSAKVEVLERESAERLAGELGIHLSGHGGTNGGMIGALAAVGLHASGDDGRFLWLAGIRQLDGELSYQQLRSLVPIDAALDPEGLEPGPEDVIVLGEWVRPVLRGGRVVLLLEPAGGPSMDRWPALAREVVKEL